jgi:antitoxin (DNA-binding transcriptional repressor) of toxin-antitoxin stability system
MQVTLQYAAEHLADLASAAGRGEDVQIACPGQPSIKLVASTHDASPAPSPGRRVFGAGRGKIIVPPWEEWKAVDKEIESEMCDAPVISSGEV